MIVFIISPLIAMPPGQIAFKQSATAEDVAGIATAIFVVSLLNSLGMTLLVEGCDATIGDDCYLLSVGEDRVARDFLALTLACVALSRLHAGMFSSIELAVAILGASYARIILVLVIGWKI